ncbi:MAG: hypothetical protein ACO4AU_08180 [bacterium]
MPSLQEILQRARELEFESGGEAVQRFLEQEILPHFEDPEAGARFCQHVWDRLMNPEWDSTA